MDNENRATCLLACYLPDSYARYRSSDFTGATAVKSDVASRVLSVSRETGELAIRGRRRIAVRELVEKLEEGADMIKALEQLEVSFGMDKRD